MGSVAELPEVSEGGSSPTAVCVVLKIIRNFDTIILIKNDGIDVLCMRRYRLKLACLGLPMHCVALSFCCLSMFISIWLSSQDHHSEQYALLPSKTPCSVQWHPPPGHPLTWCPA